MEDMLGKQKNHREKISWLMDFISHLLEAFIDVRFHDLVGATVFRESDFWQGHFRT